MILAIYGPSASGKTTVGKLLSENGWEQIVPYTTRPKRDGEIDGVDYHYITQDEMLDLYNKGKLLEMKMYDTAFGYWYYGTLRSDYENHISDRKYVILGAHGIPTLKEQGVHNLCDVRLEISENIRKARLTARNDKPEEAERRVKADSIDFAVAEAAESLYKAREVKKDEWAFARNILEPWLVKSVIDASNLTPEECYKAVTDIAESYMDSVIDNTAEALAKEWVDDIDQDFEVSVEEETRDISVEITIAESGLCDNVRESLEEDIAQAILDGEDINDSSVKNKIIGDVMSRVNEVYRDELLANAYAKLEEEDEAAREAEAELRYAYRKELCGA